MKTTGDCPDHVLPEGPVLGEDVNEGEGHREGAEEDVRDGHVGDEDVPSGDHFLGVKLVRYLSSEYCEARPCS